MTRHPLRHLEVFGWCFLPRAWQRVGCALHGHDWLQAGLNSYCRSCWRRSA